MRPLTKETIEMTRQGLLSSEWCGFSKRDTVNQLCDLALKGIAASEKPAQEAGFARLKLVQERLIAAGVKDVKFTPAGGWTLPRTEPLDSDRLANDLAALLEAYLDGRFRVVKTFGDAPASSARSQEPVTPEMIAAGSKAIDGYYDGTKDAPFEGSVAACYRAMRAVAPNSATRATNFTLSPAATVSARQVTPCQQNLQPYPGGGRICKTCTGFAVDGASTMYCANLQQDVRAEGRDA